MLLRKVLLVKFHHSDWFFACCFNNVTVLRTFLYEAQDQQNRHSEIMKAKEELAKKNKEILQLHSLLNETEQLLVCWAYTAQSNPIKALRRRLNWHAITVSNMQYYERTQNFCIQHYNFTSLFFIQSNALFQARKKFSAIETATKSMTT